VDQNIQIINFESICQAPLGPNASVKIIITLLSGITNITVTGKLLDTNSNLITFDNPTLPNTFEAIVPGGSGKNIEVSVMANSCKVIETYTLNSCNCSVNPPIPIFNNYLSCFPNGSVDIINNLVGGGQYGIDLYYESDPVPVKRLTAADSSYQILYPGQFGTYRGVSIDLATQCKTVGPSFTVSSGDFMVDFGVTTSPICAGTALILNAVVSGGYFTEQMLFKWFVNNVEQIGETSSVFTYIHPEGLG
jgi:hypothetical protein